MVLWDEEFYLQTHMNFIRHSEEVFDDFHPGYNYDSRNMITTKGRRRRPKKYEPLNKYAKISAHQNDILSVAQLFHTLK